MKKIQHTILLLLLIAISTTTQAQLGGLLKKAKDKVNEKVTEKKDAVKTTSDQSNGASQNTGSSSNVGKALGNNVEFQFPYDGKYSPTGSFWAMSSIVNRDMSFSPYDHLRKRGETGTFHFAKDYPELKDRIEAPKIPDVNFEISGSPFKEGKGDGKTSFSSSGDYIYGILKANKGTIKDAFNITTSEDYYLKFIYYIYDTDGGSDEINTGGFTSSLVITPEMAKQKELMIDIMPKKENITVYKRNNGDLNSNYAEFFYMHKQDNFPKNGNYKIRLNLSAKVLDDWGKPLTKPNQENGGMKYDLDIIFDYTFSIKDATSRVEEGQVAYQYVKENADRAPVAIPAEWKAKTFNPSMGVTQAKLVEMFRNIYDNKLFDYNFVKLHATNASGWTIMKNDIGIPLYRYSNQWYTIFMKGTGGTVCFYQGFGLRQTYEGGGQYGASFIDFEKIHYIKCEEMK